MNLQEDINRIKQVMGINENRNHFIKRRQDEFIDDIINSFEWIDIEETDSDSFEEYVEEILTHAIDSFFGHNDILVTSEEIDELIPLALQILRNEERLFKRIKRNYINYRITSRIDEANYMLPIKRRLDDIDKYIRSYAKLATSRFKDFDEFLIRIAFDTTRDLAMDYFDSEDFDDMAKMMSEFEPKVLNYIKSNKGLYDEIRNYFFKDVVGINESNELLTLKRREDALVKHIINSYDWLSPRKFKEFDDFLDKVVFSATRDFIADEIEGEYENKWRLRDKFGPIILDYIKKNQDLYDEIYDHYISNIY
jgi:hypothetical protein